jgi:hypothetical protein
MRQPLILFVFQYAYKESYMFITRTTAFLMVFLVCTTLNAQSRGGAPDWTRDPYQKYNQAANVAAVGTGNSRQVAEKDALGKLVAIFGQSIQVDEKITIKPALGEKQETMFRLQKQKN